MGDAAFVLVSVLSEEGNRIQVDPGGRCNEPVAENGCVLAAGRVATEKNGCEVLEMNRTLARPHLIRNILSIGNLLHQTGSHAKIVFSNPCSISEVANPGESGSLDCNSRSIEVRRMKISDLPALDRLWSGASEETKLFFHPDVFMAELRTTGHKLRNLFWNRITLVFCAIARIERLPRSIMPFPRWTVLVASRTDRILGFAYLRLSEWGRNASLGILVQEEYQGRGFGKILMTKLLGQAIDLGIKEIRLTVIVSNSVARRLYENLGFRYTGRTIQDLWKRESHTSLEMVITQTGSRGIRIEMNRPRRSDTQHVVD